MIFNLLYFGCMIFVIIAITGWEFIEIRKRGHYTIGDISLRIFWILVASIIPFANVIVSIMIISYWIIESEFMRKQRYIKKEQSQ